VGQDRRTIQTGRGIIDAVNIHTSTINFNKSLYDPYVNILRTTTEAMSAIIGGTGSLSITPFDAFYKDPDEFSNRIARNQQVILKEEATWKRWLILLPALISLKTLPTALPKLHGNSSERWKPKAACWQPSRLASFRKK
jgi:hypothetical protein